MKWFIRYTTRSLYGDSNSMGIIDTHPIIFIRRLLDNKADYISDITLDFYKEITEKELEELNKWSNEQYNDDMENFF